MAKKKKQPDSLDTVFDFIFGQAKSPKKRSLKPPKMNGVHAKDELTKAIVDALAAPGLYLNEQVIQSINNTIGDTTLIEVNIDNLGGKYPGFDSDAGRIRIKAKDLAKLMKDPSAFVDKAYESAKSERKLGAIYSGIGAGMDALVTMAWAKSNGLSTKDAYRIGGAVEKSVLLGQYAASDVVAAKMLAENATLQSASRLGGTLLGDKKANSQLATMVKRGVARDKGVNIFGGKNAGGLWADAASRADFAKKHLGKIKVNGNSYDVRAIMSRSRSSLSPDEQVIYDHVDSTLDNFSNGVKTFNGSEFIENNLGFEDPFKVDHHLDTQINQFGFRSIYAQNAQLKGLAYGDEKQLNASVLIGQYNRLWGNEAPNNYIKSGSAQKTLKEINDLLGQQGLSKAEVTRLNEIKTDLESKLSNLNNRFYGTTDDENRGALGIRHSDDIGDEDVRMVRKAMQSQLDFEIHQLQKLVDSPSATQAQIDQLAQLKLFKRRVATIPRSNFGLLLGQLRGFKNSFDSNIVKGGFVLGMLNGTAFFADPNFAPGTLAVSGGVLFTRNKDKDGKLLKYSSDGAGKIVLPRDDNRPIWRNLTGLYYLTPGSLMKTFFYNGEGFLFRAHMQHRGMFRTLNRSLSDPASRQALAASFAALNNPALNAFLHSVGGTQEVNLSKINSDFIEFLDAISTTPLAQNPGIKKLIEGQKSIEKLINLHERFSIVAKQVNRFNKFRKETIAKWMTKLFKDSAFGKKLTGFLTGSLGLRQIVEAAVRSALTSLGTSFGGPVGTVIAWIVTEAAMFVVDAVAKPLLKFGLYVVWAIIILAFLLILGVGQTTLRLNTPHAYLPPNPDAVVLFSDPLLYPEDPVYPPIGDPVFPGYTGCPVSPMSGCHAGPIWHTSGFSTGTPAIDVSGGPYWVAPDNGRVTSIIREQFCRDNGANYGGTMLYVDSKGQTYRIIHIKALAPVGPVKKGQAIGIMETGLTTSGCWTGPHLHLDFGSGVQSPNAVDWYNALGCNVPTCNPP